MTRNSTKTLGPARELALDELDAVSGGKLSSFRIQMLMSNYNEAQTTLSSIVKSYHDTNSAIIGKI
jgi:hypothetical protein